MAVGAGLTGMRCLARLFLDSVPPRQRDFPQDPVVWSLYTEVYAGLAPCQFSSWRRGGRMRRRWRLCARSARSRCGGADFAFGLFFVLGAWAALRWRFNSPGSIAGSRRRSGASPIRSISSTPSPRDCSAFRAGNLARDRAAAGYWRRDPVPRGDRGAEREASRWVGRLGPGNNQSAVGNRRITNSIWPSASSRQNSISVI